MKINNVTIAGVAGTKALETLKAIKYSMKELEFDRAVLITPEEIQDDEVEIIKCEPLNYEQYNHFIVIKMLK
jgi:phage major head subunit gpT-like protein